MTQEELCSLAEISQPTLSAIEKGNTKAPEAVTILRLAAALKTTPYYIMWNHDQPKAVDQTMSKLVDIWTHLNDPKRLQLIAYAQGLADAKETGPPRTGVKTINKDAH